MATSPHTLLRNALIAALTADATITTLCNNRATGRVVSWNSVQPMVLPVIAVKIADMREEDGIDDPHQALVLFSAMADGAQGLPTAEALAQRAREVVATLAVSGPGVTATINEVTTETIDDTDLVPPGRGRVDLTVRYRVEVG